MAELPALSREEAIELAQRGAAVVALGLPTGRQFGLDLRSYTVGDKFLGMKMIPIGTHLMVYGTEDDCTGVFLRLGTAEVSVFQWSAATELLLPLGPDESEPHARATRAFFNDSQLAPYPLATWDTWTALSNQIDERVLRRAGLRLGELVAPSAVDEEEILAAMEKRRLAHDGDDALARRAVKHDARTNGSGAEGSARVSGIEESRNLTSSTGDLVQDASVRATARFVQVDPSAPRARGDRGIGGRTGRDLTSFLIDRSEWLSILLQTDFGGAGDAPEGIAETGHIGRAAEPSNADAGAPDQSAAVPPSLTNTVTARLSTPEASLLGELQLAFLLFLRLSCLRSLEAWKQLIHLLCSCDVALVQRQALYIHFLQTLRAQLAFAPVDFFEDDLSADNFLLRSLGGLVQRLDETHSGISPALRAETHRLREFVKERFRLDLDEGSAAAGGDDDEPVVVDL